jgi:aminomethyltransferase
VIDDLIVYRLVGEEFLLVVNAAKIVEDAAWLGRRVALEDASDRWAALAVQGPGAARVHDEVFGVPMPERNRIVTVGGGGYSAGTGYTGEAGFEVFVGVDDVVSLWRRVLAAGAEPCGLGARDTLRLEMGYPLNGADLSADRTPLEAGLGYFVDFGKGDFVGRDALVAQREGGLACKLCALRVDEKSPPIRAHYGVFGGGERIAETTSGALSPSLGVGIAMAYLPVGFAAVGTRVEIDVRGRRYAASVVKKPFYNAR